MSDSEQPSCSVEVANTKDDLDILLDSALGDFEKPLPKVVPQEVADSGKAEPKSSKDTENAQWGTKEFERIQDAMQSFLRDSSDLPEFERLAGASADASSNLSDEFSASLEEAMKTIADTAHSIPESSIEELTKLLGETSFNRGDMPFLNSLSQPSGKPFSDVKGLMCTLMQNLLSKEVLYPALKDIVNKYPEWLADNRLKLEDSVYQNYSQQYDFMKQICEEFEADREQTEVGQSELFDKVLSLMQKMQECGNPPKELMGPHYPDLPLDEHGNFKLDGLPEPCNIM